MGMIAVMIAAPMSTKAVGVAGNHDDFGRDKDKHKLMSEPNIHLLDGEVVELDGIRFGGVGYIIGNPARRGRRSEEDQLAKISQVLDQKPDVLLLHEGPSGDDSQRGNDLIRSLVLESETPMTICGHCHWDRPLSTSPRGKQLLNVDARAVLLVPGT